MRIVNIMFSAIAGGIEQAFIDYCEGLSGRGHEVIAITHPKAAINPELSRLPIQLISMGNVGKWDILAILRLRARLKALKPDVVIAHANRALSMTSFAIGDTCPLVGIAQNYTTSLLSRADAAFATTHDLIASLEAQGIASEKIFHIPNMVRCNELPQRRARRRPPIIGSMGRFVKKKGFDVYIDALKMLHERGRRFTAVLGGSGEEEKRLKARARASGLEEVIHFPGWVADKKAFYTGIDLFCLPSLHEPFGIVLLEAFIHGTPVVATDSEGPRDIITPNFDALIAETGSAASLAAALEKLLANEAMADELAANAFAKAKTVYSIEGVAAKIEASLEKVVKRQ